MIVTRKPSTKQTYDTYQPLSNGPESPSIALTQRPVSTPVLTSPDIIETKLDRKEIKEEKKDELSLTKIIKPSSFDPKGIESRTSYILRNYNKNVHKSAVTTTSNPFRGRRLETDKFLLVHRNKIPELVQFSENRIALCISGPSTIIEEIAEVKQNAVYYGRHGSHVVNVPIGKLAKAISNNEPVILGEGPHVIHDTNFFFDEKNGLVDRADPYIQHGNIHILTIPAGKIAKIWIGSEPQLLESRPEPYIFQSTLFRLDPASVTREGQPILFESATAKKIEHGSLKRIIPDTGEVAITYNNGKLEIIDKPTTINSATHRFSEFLTTSVQTLLFPSEETKSKRRKDGATAEEIAYEVFTTKDSLKVGVKLLVAYAISDPAKLIKRFGSKASIIDHIENLATVDMGMAIQQSSAQEFLSSEHTKPKNLVAQDSKSDAPCAPELQSIQDRVRDKLSHDLKQDGIELVRLNFETPKVLDEKIGKEMSQQSLLSATISAKEAVVDKETVLSRKNAQRVAESKKIEQDQINANMLAAAQAELEVAKRKAEALLITAEAEQKAAEFRGKIYKDNPELLQLELAKLHYGALKETRMLVTPDEIRSFMMGSSSMLFAQRNRDVGTVDNAQQNLPKLGEMKI